VNQVARKRMMHPAIRASWNQWEIVFNKCDVVITMQQLLYMIIYKSMNDKKNQQQYFYGSLFHLHISKSKQNYNLSVHTTKSSNHGSQK
jgi:hypothetical protein